MQEAATEEQIGYRMDELFARDKAGKPKPKEGPEAYSRWLLKLRATATHDLRPESREYKIPRVPDEDDDERVRIIMIECFHKAAFRRQNTAWVRNWVQSKTKDEKKKAEADPTFQERFAEAREELRLRRGKMAWYSRRQFQF